MNQTQENVIENSIVGQFNWNIRSVLVGSKISNKRSSWKTPTSSCFVKVNATFLFNRWQALSQIDNGY